MMRDNLTGREQKKKVGNDLCSPAGVQSTPLQRYGVILRV